MTVLLCPYREDEHLAREAAGVTIRVNRILALQDVPVPECPIPPPDPPKGQRGRGKKVCGSAGAGSSSELGVDGDNAEEDGEEGGGSIEPR